MTTREIAIGAPASAIEALTVFNVPVFRSHQPIVDLVGQRVDRACAALFALPVEADGQLSWFTELPGQIRPWLALNEAERLALDATRSRLGESLGSLVAELTTAGINTRRGNLGQMLHAALEVPGLEYLFVVGDQLVLTYWGFRRVGQPSVTPFSLPEPPPQRPPDPPLPRDPSPRVVPPVAAARRSSWRGIALLALVLVGALGAWWFERVSPPALPLDRWNNRDLALLRGCWALGQDHGVIHLRNGKKDADGIAKTGRLCLDDSGHGKRTERMEYPFGVIDCESTVVAAFAANGDLSITQPASACKPAGESWLASIMKCARRNDDEASCIDRSEGIAQDTEVLFRRE